MRADARPSRRARLLAALTIGAVWGLLAARYFATADREAGDFTAIWLAAQAVLGGHEPYATVLAWERARDYDNQLGLYYPLPAALLGMPFVGLTPETAGAALVACSFALAAYAMTSRSWVPLAAFAGPAAFSTAQNAQLGGLLLAAMFLPRACGWLVALKPTVGAAAWAWRPHRASIVGGLLVVAASLLVEPTWPWHWLATVRGSPWAMVPVAHAWFAPVLLLAALRWRTPDGRLLLALSLVPHTLYWCDEMILGATLRTWREALYVTLIGWVGLLLFAIRVRILPLPPDIPHWLHAGIPWSIAALYLPVLVVVLRRPNEGAIPAWLEDRLARAGLPGWLRGAAAPLRSDGRMATSSQRP